MSLVFAGVCSHAPGITGRRERADPKVRDAFYAA
jgi:2,3-dihydroxyphenylpropionate 1,2-dioxygenase